MPKTGKVFLHGTIGFDWWNDIDNTSRRFISDLDEAVKNNDQVIIHINSVGGDVIEGMGIFSAIYDCPKPTIARIDGIAASMAGIISQAADQVEIAQGGMFMIHNASGISWGNAKDMRTYAATLDKFDKALATNLANRTGKLLDQVMAEWMNYEDNWFNSDEALEANLVDQILEVEAKVPQGNVKDQNLMKVAASWNPSKNSTKNRGVLEKIQNFIDNHSPKPKGNPENKNPEPMKILTSLVALMAFFGLSAKADQDQVEFNPTADQLQELNDRLEEASSLEDQLSAMEKERDSLQSSLEKSDEEKSGLESKIKSLTDQVESLKQKADPPQGPRKKGDDTEENDDDLKDVFKNDHYKALEGNPLYQ